MNIVILADKYQKGMKSKGGLGLLKINSRSTIFDYQYKHIKKAFPKSKIIYVYGFDNKKIENYLSKEKYTDVIQIYNPEYENYNYTYSLNLAKEYLDGDTIITFGDVLFHSNLFKNFDKKRGSQVFINLKKKEKIGCIVIDDRVNHISFDLNNYLSNIYYLEKKDIEDIKKLVGQEKFRNYFLFEIINKSIDNNICFSPFVINSKNHIHNLNQIKVKS